jgi:hypothetical protein
MFFIFATVVASLSPGVDSYPRDYAFDMVMGSYLR